MIKRIALFTLLGIVSLVPWATAYERGTHREISERAADPAVSRLDQVLKEEIGLTDGVRRTLIGRQIRGLVGSGADEEDVPFLRPLNHFHNPLLSWGDAGLSMGYGLVARANSSVLWQQTLGQDATSVRIALLPWRVGGGDWSWQDTRRRYLDALTGTDRAGRLNSLPSGREQTLAEVFLGLGHLVHLIQDATVPAHVRNDAHPDFLPFQEDGYEKWVERVRTQARRRAEFDALLALPPVRPPASIFTETKNPDAPVPIARLIDTDRFERLSFGLLTDTDLGVAEYTNGNFLSRDTIFRGFDLPRPTSLEPTPFAEAEGARFRTYFSKVTEGEAVPHFVAVGALQRKLREALQVDRDQVPAGGWVLEDRVHRDYAARLIPRAVGFSAALLDYFVRGRLDVDLFAFADPEGVDPAVVQVRGTNVSDDALGAGTLRLYADDPAGVRTPLPPASPTADLTVTAAPGQPVVSAPFRMTADAERVVAVYQGKLGEEKPDPSRSFPGAVIGKVLGGVRVEELFAEPDTEEKGPGRWMLRTPKGVYPLRGFTTAQYERVTWGEGQDIVLAWTPFTPEQAVFRTFAIPRQPGSIEPLLTETPAGREVVLRPLQEARFPFGRKVGPTVAFSDSLDYAQRFARFEVTSVWVEKVIPPDEYRRCVYERTDLGTVTLEPAHTQPITFSGSFPLLLDVAHNVGFGTTDRPYVWALRWVGAAADGALRALVSLHLTQPEGPVVTVPYFKLNQDGVKEPDGEFTVAARFPYSLPLWLLLDLTDGTVLGSTAGEGAQLTLALADTARGFPRVYARSVEDKKACEGGAREDGPWGETQPRLAGEQDPLDIVVPVDTALGTRSFAPDQWLTPELQDLGGFAVGLALVQRSDNFVYGCVQNAGRTSCGALRQTSSFGQVVPGDSLDLALRPGGPQERVVFLSGQGGFGDAERALLWEPGARTARVLFAPRLLGESGYLITGATSSALMVTALGGAPFYLAALDGDPAPRLFERTDGWALALLEPRYLYDAFALKFLRLTEPQDGPAPLTALPATLAGGTESNPIGYYHAIRVP